MKIVNHHQKQVTTLNIALKPYFPNLLINKILQFITVERFGKISWQSKMNNHQLQKAPKKQHIGGHQQKVHFGDLL